MKNIGIIGSGNWGSAIAKLLGENVQKGTAYSKTVNMWVYEEQVNGRNLSEIINTEHENVKYLPGTKLPENVKAVTSLEDVTKASDVLVFVIPHEFLEKTLKTMQKSVKKGAVAVSLIKGGSFDNGKFVLLSQMIEKALSAKVCTLMGANIASDVAKESLSECTLEYKEKAVGEDLARLFSSKYFRVAAVEGRGQAEACGFLKNVVALGCGIVSGRGSGPNTVAAVIRNGFLEIVKFCDIFVEKTSTDKLFSKIFLESCGVADIIVSCTSGRNFKFSHQAATQNKTIPEIEKTEMNGQKLQGYSTATSLSVFLEETKKEKDFPLLYAISKTAQQNLSSKEILDALSCVCNEKGCQKGCQNNS